MTVYYSAHVDGGIRGSGISVFADKTLLVADYVPNPCKQGNHMAAFVSEGRALKAWLDALGVTSLLSTLTFEHPRVLDTTHQAFEKQNVDPNDLLPMVGVAGALGALLPETVKLVSVYPDEWKHKVDKFVMNGRVWDRLTPEERTRVCRRTTAPPGTKKVGLDHNTFDGVGLGLHHVGRMVRIRVFE